MLEQGGNAADAALAAAAVLCVAEPMSTGVGGDAFGIVWKDGSAVGLDAAGPAPAEPEAVTPVDEDGPRSVTVPGAVAGWAELAERYGRFGLDTVLRDAIDAAADGVALSVKTGEMWERYGGPADATPQPILGATYRMPGLANTLRTIANDGPSIFYRGRIADEIAATCWLEPSDLASYFPKWVEPLSVDYRGVTVWELPPPTQGIAALEGLGLLGLEERVNLRSQVECVQLALEDALANVRDGADVEGLIRPEYLARRRRETPARVLEPPAGTIYLCAVDGDGMAVSFIQSLYRAKGPEVPSTGIVLHNRGAGFSVSGQVEPGRRPYHTIIPGLLTAGGTLLGPFGLMGGFMQAQGHVQVASALLDDGADPQAALDRPRFRLEGGSIFLEQGLWDQASLVEDLGEIQLSEDPWEFGAGHAIIVKDDVLLGGADARKDGYAAGF